MNNALSTRYPGLSSFTTAQKDIFFGRKQETRDLTNLISVERAVVLFSKSGYGKTSILQAGVVPLLYGHEIVPVPIRFGTDALLPEQHFSVQLDAAHRRFHGLDDKKAVDSSKKESAWGQVVRSPFGLSPVRFTPLLIFDQFEELFTLYPEPEKRAKFILDLADLIHERLPLSQRQRLMDDLDARNITLSEASRRETPPPMKFIFSIRSDMLHFMDELSEQIPYILRSRYQLFGLDEMQAIEAIERPAALDGSFASPRFGFEESARREILTVLTKNKEVESFQLQAVCQAIEEKIIGDRKKFGPVGLLQHDEMGLPLIDSAFYGGHEGIDSILEESYNRRLAGLAAIDKDWPEAAHKLLEDALINKNDRRQSVDAVELIGRYGADSRLLLELERQRLVRKEPKLESFYYEISHDTWLKPVLKSKKIRLEAEEKERLKVQAITARAEKEKALGERKRARIMAWIAAVAAVLSLFTAFHAFEQTKRAGKAETEALNKKREAEIALDKFMREKTEKEKMATDTILREVETFIRSGDRALALKFLEKAVENGNTDKRITEKIENLKQ